MPSLRGLLSRLRHVVKVRHQTLLDLTDASQIIDHPVRMPCATARITERNVGMVAAWRGEQIADAFRGFVADRQCGVYGLADGKVVGHLWIVICHPGEGSRLANGYLKLLEREAMLHFGRVGPVCQGKGVFQAILAHACRSAFLDDGVRRIIADPPVPNVPSRKAIEKTGYVRYGHGWYVQLGRKLLFSRERYDDTPDGARAEALRAMTRAKI